MSNEEANQILKELYEVRPEKLNDKAKRLFEAMMKIADERDSVKADLYEANNRINDLLDIVKQKDKEIEELKASHITTNNKATNTEKAKIFDVIENSIDTYIEKSKPYWEQIMTKDEMTIDEALTIIDDMYQDRYKIMSQKTDRETIVDLGKMDYIKFTNLEWASVRALREVQSLNHKLEKLQDKIKAKIEEVKDGTFDAKIVLQSLLEKE